MAEYQIVIVLKCRALVEPVKLASPTVSQGDAAGRAPGLRDSVLAPDVAATDPDRSESKWMSSESESLASATGPIDPGPRRWNNLL
jgi:hypothetical protein